MDQHKYRTAGVQEKLEIIGVEDEAGNPISALTILSLLERVAGIIDNVQSCQVRMEERQLELENNIRSIQGDVLKLAKDHTDTSGTVEKLLQKTRKVSANVKEVRTRVEKQNVRVKKVESTQDELLTRNKFRVVIYQVSREQEHLGQSPVLRVWLQFVSKSIINNSIQLHSCVNQRSDWAQRGFHHFSAPNDVFLTHESLDDLTFDPFYGLIPAQQID